MINEQGCFSIIDVYLKLAKDHKVMGYTDDDSYWLDIGTPEKLQKAEEEIDIEKFIQKRED